MGSYGETKQLCFGRRIMKVSRKSKFFLIFLFHFSVFQFVDLTFCDPLLAHKRTHFYQSTLARRRTKTRSDRPPKHLTCTFQRLFLPLPITKLTIISRKILHTTGKYFIPFLVLRSASASASGCAPLFSN